jgi:hypothetical protein
MSASRRVLWFLHSPFSCYVEKISIFFIIELASQSSVLYEHLSGSAISKLCIKKLYSMPANDYMNSFMTQVGDRWDCKAATNELPFAFRFSLIISLISSYPAHYWSSWLTFTTTTTSQYRISFTRWRYRTPNLLRSSNQVFFSSFACTITFTMT